MLYDPKWEVPAETKPVELWRKIMLDAANYIDAHGLHKGAFRGGRSVCAMGAMAEVGDCLPFDVINEALDRLTLFINGSIPFWNDAPSRTKADVVATMRACANARL
jgi:hypothetical protein